MEIKEPVVLLVDDEPNIIHGYARHFRKSKFKTFTAHSAEEAMDILKRTTVDVVVSDQYMKEMKGTELLGWIREHFPKTVRIVLTGSQSEITVTEASESDVFRYLTKPTSHEELAQAINDGLVAGEEPEGSTTLQSS